MIYAQVAAFSLALTQRPSLQSYKKGRAAFRIPAKLFIQELEQSLNMRRMFKCYIKEVLINSVKSNSSPCKGEVGRGMLHNNQVLTALLHPHPSPPPLGEGINQHFLKVIFSQLIQNTACTKFHVVEARLARLLLMMRDRAQSQSFHVRQESLAHMLGVRRVGVTKAAGMLQFKKLISYSRGDIVIHDNTGLEA